MPSNENLRPNRKSARTSGLEQKNIAPLPEQRSASPLMQERRKRREEGKITAEQLEEMEPAQIAQRKARDRAPIVFQSLLDRKNYVSPYTIRAFLRQDWNPDLLSKEFPQSFFGNQLGETEITSIGTGENKISWRNPVIVDAQALWATTLREVHMLMLDKQIAFAMEPFVGKSIDQYFRRNKMPIIGQTWEAVREPLELIVFKLIPDKEQVIEDIGSVAPEEFREELLAALEQKVEDHLMKEKKRRKKKDSTEDKP